MITDLLLLKTGSGPAALHANDRIADVRRDGWLYALERAMLAGGSRAQAVEQARERLGAAGHDESQDIPPDRERHMKMPATEGTPLFASAWLAARHQGPVAAQAGIGQAQGTPVNAHARLTNATTAAGDVADRLEPQKARAVLRSAGPASAAMLRLRQEDIFSISSAEAFQASAGQPGQPCQHYGRQQLHLYLDENGMQAWIRDADLRPALTYRLAAAFSRLAWQSGARLASLTVNGKKVVGGLPGNLADAAFLDFLTQPGELAPKPGGFAHGN